MLKFVYQIIVFYLSLHLFWHLVRQKDFWSKASTVLVLTLFLLRLFWIK
jgi:hypothetical protein